MARCANVAGSDACSVVGCRCGRTGVEWLADAGPQPPASRAQAASSTHKRQLGSAAHRSPPGARLPPTPSAGSDAPPPLRSRRSRRRTLTMLSLLHARRCPAAARSCSTHRTCAIIAQHVRRPAHRLWHNLTLPACSGGGRAMAARACQQRFSNWVLPPPQLLQRCAPPAAHVGLWC